MSAKNFTGIIDNSDDKLLFHNEDFFVTVFQNKIYPPNTAFPVSSDHGFISATTHNGKKIIIHIGTDRLEGWSSSMLLTDLIIESSTNATKNPFYYSKIRFTGGVLKQLRKNAEAPFHISEGKTVIPRPRPECSYHFKANNSYCTISIGYITRTRYSSDDGYSVTDDVYCELSFEEEQHVSSLYKHFKCFNDLISIMTNRRKNAYDEISLFPSQDETLDLYVSSRVYLKENEKATTSKKPSISFDDLKDSIPTLLELIYNSKQNKPSYSISFIPTDENDFWNITDDRVRSVFAALECEVNTNKSIIKQTDNPDLDNFCKEIKKFVKDYRKEHEDTSSISERTYNLIFESIKHWSLTAFEQIVLLFQNYKEEITAYNAKWFFDIFEDDINAFVKYRNNITHGNYREMTKQIRDCTMSMQALVLCSLLDRAGVAKDTIKKLCEYGLSD